MKKAVFLDRDGTIIEDLGYIKSVDAIKFFDSTFQALRSLQEDYLLFLITNQSGVGKGLLNMREVRIVNQEIVNTLKSESIAIKKIYVCPHTKEDNCKCHKPSPFFLLEASIEYDLDLSKSYLIGDHPGDVYCAENAGSTGIYLLTGHGKKHLKEFTKRPIIKADILQAAKFVKSNNINN